MDLKDCLISGTEISSSSLKTLAMVKCNMFWGLTITAPNLVLLRCVEPIGQAPSFNNMGSLVAGTIRLDDLCFRGDFEDFSKDELDETTDDDSDDEVKKWRHRAGGGYGFGWRSGYKDAIEYGSDIESDDSTYEYSEIASESDGSGYDDVGDSSSKVGNLQACGETSGCGDSKISGGRNIIHSLSNATSLELLADGGEVILTRELKSCPGFINLKTLSLGEWSMASDFDRLLLFLQCSPNLEKLFLELKLNFNVRKAMEIGVKPSGRPFACKHLRMVKIKCSKDDIRVHKLARLFKANGVSVEKIFVHRTGSSSRRR